MASTTCEPLRILLVVASLSGNTRELARRIAAHCHDAGHHVHWQEADALDGPSCIAAGHADLVLLGSWTDNGGRTPTEMKAWVTRLGDGGRHLHQVAVFGTGETQWGQEYFCGAVHGLARHFHSRHPPLTIEQMPHGRHDARIIGEWTHAVLAAAAQDRASGTQGKTEGMRIIDAATIEQVRSVIASQPRLLVDFHKDQCPACRMLELALQRVAGGGAGAGVTLLRVRMEVVGEAFFRSLGLRQTPTLALFRDGQEMLRMAGYQSPPQIQAAMAADLS